MLRWNIAIAASKIAAFSAPMWFKNLVCYRLGEWVMNAERLEELLSRQALRPCSAMETESRGWCPPAGEGGPLVHVLNRQMLVALGIEAKLLPSSVINQYAAARAAEIEETQGYRPGRKQMRDIKERIAEELLPRAFVRRRAVHAWIDPAGGWLVVDAANAARADELVEHLRKSVDELPLRFARSRLSPVTAMTGWLAANEAPAGFSIDRDCELLSPGEDKATVRYVRHPLEAPEVRSHLAEGKQVTRLAMTWADRISFVLHENMQVKRLVFLDMLKEQSEQQVEAGDGQFDADFAIMTGELARFVLDLLEALGGEAEQE